jgi:hypothetical protein
MLTNLGVLVQVPISESEARSRHLPVDVGKLVLYPLDMTREEPTSRLMRLAWWLWKWGESGGSLYASPLVPFLSEKKMGEFLASTRIERDTARIDQQTYLIRCPSRDAIASILGQCSSEAIVFMSDTDGLSARETLAAVANYQGDYRGHETPFMARLEAHGGFFFFSETHGSVEALGTKDFIWLRCLRPMLKELTRANSTEA